VIELLGEEPAVQDRAGARDLDRAHGTVELEDVTFCYPAGREPALDGVTLRIAPGETVALVGPSGAGKSTITRLLLRFHDPDAGTVRLDGHDLRDLTLGSVRRNVAAVFQETLLLDGSVRDNIAYGEPRATDEDIERAARAADAHEFIARLPEGYATRVGQRGRRLSGGQRQRIAIARAFLRDAPVLVLDEPTASLDRASADRLREPLARLSAGRATLLISHDPGALEVATRTVVLDGGGTRPCGEGRA
jgi:ABC-type multidrug transport system fused ATPase/permease subunit